MIKSLFEFHGNEEKKDAKEDYYFKPLSPEFKNPFKSSEPILNPFQKVKAENPFAAKPSSFQNPFKPAVQKTGLVFQTSLYSNPFNAKNPETQKLAFIEKD